jgi:dolichol-phosphate mannosyltransferase
MRSIIVLPTYNERENLAGIVAAILAAEPSTNVLVVDDNSPDGTGALADELAHADARVSVLHRAGKQGLGSAYLAGFRHALERGYEAIVQMDADFSHSPADLPRLLAPLRAGQADVVIGSRWVAAGGAEGWPLHRRLLSRVGSLYARTLLGLELSDLTGGFKCIHRRVLTALDLASLRACGYGFQIELTWHAIRAGFRVRELPIVFRERERGQSKLSASIVAEAAALVWRLRRERRQAAPAAPALEPAPPVAALGREPELLLEREVGA